MEFQRDGEFSATDISLSYACDPESVRPDGERVSGTGRWEMGAFPDEGLGAHITFRPKDGRPVRSCEIWTSFVGTDSLSRMSLHHDDGTDEVYERSR
ncbi:hypothetical protein [Streptomyces albidus (ex Kaewkla and Franco 2022)]|uniref:hypothetical protein n=1 Tax=Streptomyces albidus (ex Kaewkla and Franco 2022) TaxID=722709 RepID=UPI0015EF0296|nr:hypothetical protein [Streptomyces albidus (ex Kaewkla and Franco 2022)]